MCVQVLIKISDLSLVSRLLQKRSGREHGSEPEDATALTARTGVTQRMAPHRTPTDRGDAPFLQDQISTDAFDIVLALAKTPVRLA
jgi:hypothetical protein